MVAGAQLSGTHDHSIKTIESVAVTYAYGVTNDLTVSARLPWIRRTGIREAEIENPAEPPEILNRGDNSGIGDLTLLGQYRFYNNRASRTEAAVLFGVKAPTGVTDRRNNQGELFDAEFQPGSGSWDGLFGLSYTKRFGQWLSSAIPTSLSPIGEISGDPQGFISPGREAGHGPFCIGEGGPDLELPTEWPRRLRVAAAFRAEADVQLQA